MLDFTKALDALLRANKIIITTHVNPDGDAIGSAMAMYYFLTSHKKDAQIIINDSKCPDNFRFLNSTTKIQQYNSTQHEPLIKLADVIVIVDCGALERLKTLADPIRNSPAIKILIDHHVAPEPFTSLIYSNANAIATGELIYAMLQQANATITKDIAEALYTSIYTDSGGFRFPNTSAATFQIAADLVLKGASPHYIYENIYNANPVSKLLLQGMAVSSIETYFDSQLTMMVITKQMFAESQASSEHTEGLSQIPLSIQGCKVGIMISEYVNNELRVSLRSKGDFNVQQIALKYNGGGHVNAAGCRLHSTTVADAKAMLLEEVSAILL